MFRIACVALLCASASAQDSKSLQDALSRGTTLSFDAPGFEKILEHILKASTDRFRNVQGAIIENRRREHYFEARVYLPGATYCQILRDRTWWVYDCEWKKASGPSGLPALFEQLASKVQNALGTEWNRAPVARKSGVEVLFSKENQPIVQVIRESKPLVVHLFITPAGVSITGVGENLPKPPPM